MNDEDESEKSAELCWMDSTWECDSPISMDVLKQRTAEDPKLQKLISILSSGWPKEKKNLEEEISEFWDVREEISYLNGVVYRGEKYIAPEHLRARIIAFAHEGHQGISKCKSRIRSIYWWPYLNRDVEEVVKKCECCKMVPRDTPVQVVKFPVKPWTQLAIDIKGPIMDSRQCPFYIIVLIDYFTKFVYTKATRRVSSQDIISFLNEIFAILGYCSIVVSDNGPQFISSEMENYFQTKGIIHKRSSVYNPQSNGCVERVNKNLSKLLSVKDGITDVKAAQDVLNDYTLQYNATAHGTTDETPASLLLAFPIRTRLNLVGEREGDQENTDIARKIRLKQNERAEYADSRRRPQVKHPFAVGDRVITRNGLRRILTRQVGPYTFAMNDGFTVNCRHLIKDNPRVQEISPRKEVPAETGSPDIQSPDIRRSCRDRRPPSYLKDFILRRGDM